MKKLEKMSEEELQGINEFNKFILNDFITNSSELSPKTKKIYESNLNIWFNWVKNNLNDKSQLEVKPLEFKKFQNWLLNRGCSSADINNKRAAISSLNGYIEIYYGDEYPMFRNFINKSIKRPPKAVVRDKEPLSMAEFDHLISVLTERQEWQKIAYLEFTLSSGCRRAESRQLLKSIVYSNPIVKNRVVTDEDGTQRIEEFHYYQTHPIRCKGRSSIGKVRKLSFSEKAMRAIKKWLEYREQIWGADDCEYVFVSKHNGEIKQIGETTFNNWCTNDFAKIVGRRVFPHLMRSSAATQLVVEQKKDIESVRALLGHEDTHTTQMYVVRDETEDIDSLF